jgi:DNA-binding NtrC family response regulator
MREQMNTVQTGFQGGFWSETMARILVVEDDPAQRFLFVQLLRRAGYDALGAGDAQEAFSVLASGIPVDAVLMDMVMPGVHGPALFHAFQQHFPHLPVVMMSVRASTDCNIDTNAPGVFFLQKPFERHTLSEILASAINSMRSGSAS